MDLPRLALLPGAEMGSRTATFLLERKSYHSFPASGSFTHPQQSQSWADPPGIGGDVWLGPLE